MNVPRRNAIGPDRTIRRRDVLKAAPGLIGLHCALARAQRPLRRIGLLAVDASWTLLPPALAELGIVDNRDVVLDRRAADGMTDALPRLAAELVALKPELIVAFGPQATQAALAADPVVPVVALLGAAVESGLATQLGRPGGRLTGVNFLGTPLNAKRLELLAELLPKGSGVLNLGDPGARTTASVELLATASRRLGLVAHDVYAGTVPEMDAAFAQVARLRVGGVNVLGSPVLNAHRAHIIALAAKARLPAIYQWPQTARDGGLMAYGPSLSAMHQVLAGMVVRVLQGAKAGDLPIAQPTRFELVVNMQTARSLGLGIPQSLLLRADEVIA